MGNTYSKKTSDTPRGNKQRYSTTAPAIRAPRRNFNLVHTDNPGCGSDKPSGEDRGKKKKTGLDWTALRETNEWGTTFEFDSGGTEWQEHLYSNPPHQWVIQQALDLCLMEQRRLFEMQCKHKHHTARVAPMPRAQIIDMPVEQKLPDLRLQNECNSTLFSSTL